MGAWSVGAASAIIGLLAANTIGKAKTGEDVRPDIGLLVLLVLYAVLVGFSSFGWVTLIGGIVVGGLVRSDPGVRAAAEPDDHPAGRDARLDGRSASGSSWPRSRS